MRGPRSTRSSPGHPLRIGRYTIRRKLGTGKLGAVYLVSDPSTRGLLALKVLRTDRLTPEAVDRFQREFRSMVSFPPPEPRQGTRLRLHGAGLHPVLHWRVHPRSAAATTSPGGRSRRCPSRPGILDVLGALEYLHVHGILHLDIHPGNVILADDRSRGSVLIDFGVVPPDGVLPGGSLPARAWPPELLAGARPAPSADIFLVGKLLEYRLTGVSSGAGELPPEIPGLGPRQSLELERIVAKALDRDPGRRFQGATELRNALLEVVGRPQGDFDAAEPQETSHWEARGPRADRDGLSGLEAGTNRILWLVGSPGMGKTRLLEEARIQAQILGLDTVFARFFAGSGPGETLLELLRRWRPGGRPRWLEPPCVPAMGEPRRNAPAVPRSRASRRREALCPPPRRPRSRGSGEPPPRARAARGDGHPNRSGGRAARDRLHRRKLGATSPGSTSRVDVADSPSPRPRRPSDSFGSWLAP